MSLESRTKKIAYFLEDGKHPEQIEQMKKDIANCNTKIERDYIERHYKQYYKKRGEINGL